MDEEGKLFLAVLQGSVDYGDFRPDRAGLYLNHPPK
jgi:hypothetical protein